MLAYVSPTPWSDLTHSQYLWPSAAVELRVLAANASARAEYKAQLQRQYESSQAFQRQFAMFVAQLVHERQRATDLFGVSSLSPSRSLTPPVPASSPPSPSGISTYPRSVCRRPPDMPLNSRLRQKVFLIPPRPRLSSVLSPTPRNTNLPGPMRRPVPPRRARAVPEALLKQALLNSTHGRPAADGPRVDAEDVDERLDKSWVIVTREDWEVIDTETRLQ